MLINSLHAWLRRVFNNTKKNNILITTKILWSLLNPEKTKLLIQGKINGLLQKNSYAAIKCKDTLCILPYNIMKNTKKKKKKSPFLYY